MQRESKDTGILGRGARWNQWPMHALVLSLQEKDLPIGTVKIVGRSQSQSGRNGLCGELNFSSILTPSQSTY
jgi:hypothetical protein